MTPPRETLHEEMDAAERLARRILETHQASEMPNTLAKAVLALRAENARLAEQVKAQRDQLVEGLRDVWGQFSHPMGDGWAHDGGLSTLAWVAEDLVTLGAFEKHPKREWFRAYAQATGRTDAL